RPLARPGPRGRPTVQARHRHRQHPRRRARRTGGLDLERSPDRLATASSGGGGARGRGGGHLAAARLLADPGQERGRARDERGGEDLGLVIAVLLDQERGQLLVPVGRELEEDEPLLGPLDLVVPPVGGGDRARYLAAGGQPRRDRRPRQLHRLGPRVGRRLYLQIFAGRRAVSTVYRHAT